MADINIGKWCWLFSVKIAIVRLGKFSHLLSIKLANVVTWVST